MREEKGGGKGRERKGGGEGREGKERKGGGEGREDLLFSSFQTLPEGRSVSDEFLVLLACGRAR